jgi:hypothetical protein
MSKRLSNITLRQTQIKVKEKLVVRTDIDVNGHERLSNITLRQTQIKVEEKLVARCSFTLICVCLSVMLDNLSCPFTSISFLTTSCSFTLICVCLSVMLDSLSCGCK